MAEEINGRNMAIKPDDFKEQTQALPDKGMKVILGARRKLRFNEESKFLDEDGKVGDKGKEVRFIAEIYNSEKLGENLVAKESLQKEHLTEKANELLEKEKEKLDAAWVLYEYDFEKRDFKETERKSI